MTRMDISEQIPCTTIDNISRRHSMKNETVLKVRDWVEVLPLKAVLATLDRQGQLEGLPFMPEMVPYCGKRFEVTTVMSKICYGGRASMRTVTGAPLLLLGDLRCEGSSHGGCSRLCTLLWKVAWLKPVDGPSSEPSGGTHEIEAAWPYPIRTGSGSYQCQATDIPKATAPMSPSEKLGRALADVATGEWGIGPFLKVCAGSISYRMPSLFKRFGGGFQQARQPTPTDSLALQPGEWVETKSVNEIAATLDRNKTNKGLAFSDYMAPYCGRKYRVKSRVGKFIDERTGNMKELKNTVILEGIICGGETTAGRCRRAEYFYWRETWLKRTENFGQR